jgi:hypothetical protein
VEALHRLEGRVEGDERPGPLAGAPQRLGQRELADTALAADQQGLAQTGVAHGPLPQPGHGVARGDEARGAQCPGVVARAAGRPLAACAIEAQTHFGTPGLVPSVGAKK